MHASHVLIEALVVNECQHKASAEYVVYTQQLLPPFPPVPVLSLLLQGSSMGVLLREAGSPLAPLPCLVQAAETLPLRFLLVGKVADL